MATLELLKRDEHFAFLYVLDPDGAELISHGKPEAGSKVENVEALAALPLSEVLVMKPYLLLKEEIVFDDELLGSAVIGLDTRARDRLIRESILFTVIVNAILAVIGIGVILWVTQSVICRPCASPSAPRRRSPRVTSPSRWTATARTKWDSSPRP